MSMSNICLIGTEQSTYTISRCPEKVWMLQENKKQAAVPFIHPSLHSWMKKAFHQRKIGIHAEGGQSTPAYLPSPRPSEKKTIIADETPTTTTTTTHSKQPTPTLKPPNSKNTLASQHYIPKALRNPQSRLPTKLIALLTIDIGLARKPNPAPRLYQPPHLLLPLLFPKKRDNDKGQNTKKGGKNKGERGGGGGGGRCSHHIMYSLVGGLAITAASGAKLVLGGAADW